jgi:hypothetical protein
MAIKLVALDMDGTLLDGGQDISPENRRWIRRAMEAGVTVCLASGRGRGSMLPYYERLGLSGQPFVAVNGGEVWRDANRLLSRRPLDRSLNGPLKAIAEAHDTWFWAYGLDGYLTKANWDAAFEKETWLKFGYYTEDPEALARVKEALAALGPLEITNSDPNNLEVNPCGVSKAAGLAEVCRELGIRMEDAMAVGDSLNDLAMIRQAGIGVAMGNAQPAVKRAADAVVAGNEEDGVAEAIRRFVFGEAAR